MASNLISLYKKVDDVLLEKMGLEDVSLEMSYPYFDEEKSLNLPDSNNIELVLNEIDPEWNPVLHDLNLNLQFEIENPAILYGEHGVSLEENTISLGAKIYSKTAQFQTSVHICDIPQVIEPLSINHAFYFHNGLLRGQLRIELFLYLSKVHKSEFGLADKEGMILTEQPLLEFDLIIDGSGSVFPITEFQEKDGPFWKIEKRWISADEDIFVAPNVSLALNTAHPLFNKISNSSGPVNKKIMNDVIAQFMAIIIQQVVLIEELSLEDAEESEDNSILRMVSYWVDTYEIDTSSIFTITNSLNTNIESKMRGVDLD